MRSWPSWRSNHFLNGIESLKDQLKSLILPALFLGAVGLLTALVLWGSVVTRPVVYEPGAERHSRVDERLSRQERSLIDYFDSLPVEAGRLRAARNPFFVEFAEPEEEPEEEEPEEAEEEEEEEEEEPAPPPPPRRIEIRYSGFLRGSQGGLQAYLVKDGSILVGGEGMEVVDDWRIEEFDSERLVLVDSTGDSFEVGFNQRRVLEIPVEPED